MADFQTLAQIAAPRMMPDAPSVGAGLSYGMDQARQSNFLAQAAQSAQMQQAMEAMKSQEFAAGHPGRMDAASLSNMQNKDTLDAYSNDGMGRSLAFGKMDTANAQNATAKLKALLPLLQEIASADTDEDAKSAYDDLVKLEPKFGKVTLEDMRKRSKSIIKGQVNSPEYQQKQGIAQTKANADMAKESYKQGQANYREQMKIQARAQLEHLKQSNPNLYNLAMQAAGGDAELALQKALEIQAKLKVAPIMQQGANQVDQANAILPPNKQMPQPQSVVPNLTGSTPKPNGSEFKRGAMWNDGKKEQKIVDIHRTNGKVDKIKLEDGTVVPINGQ